MKHIEATKLALDAETSIEKARKTLSGLCDGTTRWTMSVPARPDEDPDLIIAAAFRDAGAAITALREALAEQPSPPPECQTEAEKTAYAFGWFKALESVRKQPAQQEPVAYLVDGDLYYPEEIDWETLQEQGHTVTPLYTSPPPQRTWVGLTDKQMRQICGSVPIMREAVREAEAILKEGNT